MDKIKIWSFQGTLLQVFYCVSVYVCVCVYVCNIWLYKFSSVSLQHLS